MTKSRTKRNRTKRRTARKSPSRRTPKHEAKSDAKDADKKDDKKADKDKKPKPVEIDLDGFEQRLVILPPKAGRYADLCAVPGKLLYRVAAAHGFGRDGQSVGVLRFRETRNQARRGRRR